MFEFLSSFVIPLYPFDFID